MQDDISSDSDAQSDQLSRRGLLGTAAGAAAVGLFGIGSVSAHDGGKYPDGHGKVGEYDSLDPIFAHAWEANYNEKLLYETALETFSESEFEAAYEEVFYNDSYQYSTYNVIEWLLAREELQLERLETLYDWSGKPESVDFESAFTEWMYDDVGTFVEAARDFEWGAKQIQGGAVQELLLYEHRMDNEFSETAGALEVLMEGVMMDAKDQGVLRLLDFKFPSWNVSEDDVDDLNGFGLPVSYYYADIYANGFSVTSADEE